MIPRQKTYLYLLIGGIGLLFILCRHDFTWATTQNSYDDLVPFSWGDLPQDVPQGDSGLIGTKIVLRKKYSPNIRNLKLNLILPAGYQFLASANSQVKLFTKNRKLVKSFKISDLNADLVLNKSIVSESLSAEMMLYYCRQGDQGVCLIKNIIFEIPLDRQSDLNDIVLKYELPAESF